MAEYRISQISAFFDSDISRVWNVVTDNLDYGWRSDVEKIEILNKNNFIEYSRQGAVTEFHITKYEKNVCYAFDMKNKMFNGSWIGEFTETEQGGTRVEFTEKIMVINPLVRWISYLLWDLKKIQQVYIDDLRKKLGE